MLTDRAPEDEESIDDAIVKAVDDFLAKKEPNGMDVVTGDLGPPTARVFVLPGDSSLREAVLTGEVGDE